MGFATPRKYPGVLQPRDREPATPRWAPKNFPSNRDFDFTSLRVRAMVVTHFICVSGGPAVVRV